MSRPAYAFFLGCFSLLPFGEAGADVYKYTDQAGHVFYTDNPSHAGFRLIIQTPVAFTQSQGSQYDFRPSMAPRKARAHAARLAPSEYSGLIADAADRYSLDPALLHAVIKAESAYNPAARSNKGAVGLMQLMPGTAERYGVRDRYDPMENIEGGAAYLSDLISMFRSDIRLAVAAYNAGENNVIKYGHRVPPFQETQAYVAKVLDYYNGFSY